MSRPEPIPFPHIRIVRDPKMTDLFDVARAMSALLRNAKAPESLVTQLNLDLVMSAGSDLDPWHIVRRYMTVAEPK